MRRDPSLHIKESLLKISLANLLSDKDIEDLLLNLRKFSCENRSIQVNNNKVKKLTEKITQTNKASADLIASIIYNVRLQMKHKGVKRIKPNDSDWARIKDIANCCNSFCEAFELDYKQGSTIYIKNILSKLSSMRGYINKLISMYDVTCEEFDKVNQLNAIENIADATYIHDIYTDEVTSRTGIYNEYKNNPSEFIHFVNAAEICNELNVAYEDYILAQFEGLEWANSIPSPNQLDNEGARKRLMTYLSKYKIKLVPKEKEKDKKDFWKRIKQRGDQ